MDVLEERRLRDIDSEEVEIRLVDIIQFFRLNLRKIIIGGIIGLILGALYAFSQPNMFTVEVTIMPETEGKGVGGLGALSGLSSFGMDNSSTLDSRPDLFPNILESVPFAMNMLKQKVYSKKLNATMTLEDYISRSASSSIINTIRSWFTIDDDGSDAKTDKVDPKNVSQAIELTKTQYNLTKAVQASVSSSYDKKSGVITVVATEPDPVVAATIANLSLKYLTDYIISYRTDKARRRVSFLNNQVKDAKQRYEKAQYAVSNYRDRNVSLYLQTAKIEEQRLQADYLLEQSVYNELARQLEQAKIKVEEDTPTIKTIAPAVVPIYKSGPKRTFIMLGFAFVGLLITSFVLFIRSRNLFL